MDRTNRTVREKDLRIVNIVFNQCKSQVTKCKFVDPYGPYEMKMAIADRTNRTVREKHLRIVNKVYQSVQESVCDQVAALKLVDPYGSYGPYELKMASRIVPFVRTVRLVERVYGSLIKFFNPLKSQFLTM